MFLDIAFVAILTLLNGVLAMSELAIVSSRPTRLRVLARQGSRGAAIALVLLENSGRFLSTVQIGITLVGVLSGAFSGATLGARLALWLEEMGVAQPLADTLGVGLVVVAITYLSLIIGELVPKQIALRNPERIAAFMAPAMRLLSQLAAPLVWLLDASGRLVLALLGQDAKADETVTEEEVHTVLAEAESAGVLEAVERDMISGVMRLSDRSARSLMTPRRDVEVLDIADPADVILAQLHATRHHRLPVQDGEDDDIVGVVTIRDLFQSQLDGKPLTLREHIQPAPTVMETTQALEVLREIRYSKAHMVLVFDEYGHFEGIVTANDVLEAIIGAFQSDEDDEPAIVVRADGSYLVSGWMQADELADRLSISIVRGNYETAAGFVLSQLNHLPQIGESFVREGWRFEVLDLDGRRIDKILVSKVARPTV
ncbi:hemolysin family protein [Labrys monachus]|uniref:Hemolysin n=1 Tax=Labrys monachus TaxID=217067 RepID=A0ABU0FJ30_9HYPH|nr:hemolysin family protein [Labrys monachus]MDQ0394609.1 putative hemolysin [Labrys monachus]